MTAVNLFIHPSVFRQLRLVFLIPHANQTQNFGIKPSACRINKQAQQKKNCPSRVNVGKKQFQRLRVKFSLCNFNGVWLFKQFNFWLDKYVTINMLYWNLQIKFNLFSFELNQKLVKDLMPAKMHILATWQQPYELLLLTQVWSHDF